MAQSTRSKTKETATEEEVPIETIGWNMACCNPRSGGGKRKQVWADHAHADADRAWICQPWASSQCGRLVSWLLPAAACCCLLLLVACCLLFLLVVVGHSC